MYGKRLAILAGAAFVAGSWLPLGIGASVVIGGSALVTGCSGKSDTRQDTRTEQRTEERMENRRD